MRAGWDMEIASLFLRHGRRGLVLVCLNLSWRSSMQNSMWLRVRKGYDSQPMDGSRTPSTAEEKLREKLCWHQALEHRVCALPAPTSLRSCTCWGFWYCKSTCSEFQNGQMCLIYSNVSWLTQKIFISISNTPMSTKKCWNITYRVHFHRIDTPTFRCA